MSEPTKIKRTPHVPGGKAHTTEARLRLAGMRCASCVGHIEEALRNTPGVESANVNLATATARVRYRADEVSPAAFVDAVAGAGYTATVDSPPAAPGAAHGHQAPPQGEQAAHGDDHAGHGTDLPRLVVAAIASIPVVVGGMLAMSVDWVPAWLSSPWTQLIFATPIVFYSGWPFFAGAWQAARHGRTTMDTLVALGVGVAYLYSLVATVAPGPFTVGGHPPHVYYESAAVVITLVLLGRHFEALARGRASAAMRKLLDLQAKTARVLRDGAEVEVPIDQVRVGNRLRVRPGERIPVDGEVVEGESAVDQSMVTGESMPVDVAPGDDVIGGTINRSGSFVMVAHGVGSDTFLARIVQLVEDAQASRAPIQRVADQVVAYFVPVVVAIAALTFTAWWAAGLPTFALATAVAVLVIACPCAMGLATPTSIMVGTGKAAEHGILFKDAAALEATGRAEVVVFDKTGTLTKGEPSVTEVVPLGDMPADDLLAIAASVEVGSEHALGEAIVRGARERGLGLPTAAGFEAVAGHGVRAKVGGRTVVVGNARIMATVGVDAAAAAATIDRLADQGQTPVLVAVDGRLAGVLAIADQPVEDAATAIARLKQLGLSVVMLTGDHARTAQAIAAGLGIDQVHAEVLPADKVAVVAKLQAAGKRVIMVGDGVNDAPALAKADVGMAIGTGTDVAIEAADVTLLAGEVKAVVTAIALSRAVLVNIKQNLAWAFGYNIAAIPIAAGVLYPVWHLLLSPAIAGGAMAASSVCVVLNALRLRGFRPPR